MRCPNGNGVGYVRLSLFDASGAGIIVVLRDLPHVPEYDVNFLSGIGQQVTMLTSILTRNWTKETVQTTIERITKESRLWHNRTGHVNNEDLQRT